MAMNEKRGLPEFMNMQQLYYLASGGIRAHMKALLFFVFSSCLNEGEIVRLTKTYLHQAEICFVLFIQMELMKFDADVE